MSNLDWLREAIQVETDDCVEWPFCRMKEGYGQVRHSGRIRLVSHVALELVGRPWQVPFGENALHSCDNPPCVNTRHLRWGTMRQNTEDMLSRSRESRGERHGKLKEEQVMEMFELRQQGWTQQKIADQVGVHNTQVSRILRGVDWKHLDKSRLTRDRLDKVMYAYGSQIRVE